MAIACRALIDFMERHFPLELQEDYDNSGFLVGDADKMIHKAMVCLDVSLDVIKEASEYGADIIISHHPLIFNPLRSVTSENETGRCIMELVKREIALYSSHTCFDNAAGGMNAILVRRLGLKNAGVLRIIHQEKTGYDGCQLKNSMQSGTGTYGELEEPCMLIEMAERIKKAFNAPYVTIAGEGTRIVRRAAIVGGSGMEFIKDAALKDCDVLITGDVKHHNALDAIAMGICVIDAGHYYTEAAAMPELCRIIAEGTGIECMVSERSCSPFVCI